MSRIFKKRIFTVFYCVKTLQDNKKIMVQYVSYWTILFIYKIYMMFMQLICYPWLKVSRAGVTSFFTFMFKICTIFHTFYSIHIPWKLEKNITEQNNLEKNILTCNKTFYLIPAIFWFPCSKQVLLLLLLDTCSMSDPARQKKNKYV